MAERRGTFDADAERYDRARPRYPAALIDRIVGESPGRDVLEIGCGTGQLTVSLAERGMGVTAVELGAALSAVARRNLAPYRCEVITDDFERWTPTRSYDAVIAATSFHWLDPATRLDRVAALLRPGGLLAIAGTAHVAGGTGQFFVDVQHCYEQWDPATPPGLRLSSDAPPRLDHVEGSADLIPLAPSRHRQEISYSTPEYIDLLGTFSNMIELPDDRRNALFDCIASLIDGDYGGRVVKAYLHGLVLARRR